MDTQNVVSTMSATWKNSLFGGFRGIGEFFYKAWPYKNVEHIAEISIVLGVVFGGAFVFFVWSKFLR